MNKVSTCPHFSSCSGCELEKNLFRPPIWNEALSYFREAAPDLQPILHTDGFNATRLKAKLAVRPASKIGLFKKGTHEVIEIPECRVHHPSINRAALFIKDAIIQNHLSIYRENPPSGQLRYLQLAVDRETNRIQLVLVLNAAQTNPQIDAFCSALKQQDLWHSIWLNFQSDANNRILGESWQLIHGEPFLLHILNQTSIAIHPGAFSQSHLFLFETMLQKIDSWVKPHQKILELYAGAGAIGLTLRHKAAQVRLVENNPFAHLSYQQSLKLLPPEQQSLFSYECIDAKNASLSDPDLIIVDPPRKGLDPEILEKICSLQYNRLIYVSCGFDSFQRDTERLLSSGWRFEQAAGYLFFPGTNHVEILALLSK